MSLVRPWMVEGRAAATPKGWNNDLRSSVKAYALASGCTWSTISWCVGSGLALQGPAPLTWPLPTGGKPFARRQTMVSPVFRSKCAWGIWTVANAPSNSERSPRSLDT